MKLIYMATAAIFFGTTAFTQDAEETPRLVLQITVDQLRGDLIDRYGEGLGDGGFKRLLANGRAAP